MQRVKVYIILLCNTYTTMIIINIPVNSAIIVMRSLNLTINICVCVFVWARAHTYIHTYIHTYLHTYIYIYIYNTNNVFSMYARASFMCLRLFTPLRANIPEWKLLQSDQCPRQDSDFSQCPSLCQCEESATVGSVANIIFFWSMAKLALE